MALNWGVASCSDTPILQNLMILVTLLSFDHHISELLIVLHDRSVISIDHHYMKRSFYIHVSVLRFAVSMTHIDQTQIDVGFVNVTIVQNAAPKSPYLHHVDILCIYIYIYVYILCVSDFCNQF